MLERVMRSIDDSDHSKVRRQVYEEELNISQFELEADVETCMVDFPLKPYAGVEDVQAADHVANEHQVPINYYDNDDGFWDDYIQQKEQRQFDAHYLSNRKWLKH